MDHRLTDILQSLLSNIDVLNDALYRMGRSEQFAPTTKHFQLVEEIRGRCTCCMQTLSTIERSMFKAKQGADTLKGADILSISVSD